MKVINANYIYAAAVFVAMGVLIHTLPGYTVTGIFALGCLFAGFNPDNAK